jgi:Flp pilus assembly protein TadD
MWYESKTGKRITLIAAALFGVALVAAGCGGDKQTTSRTEVSTSNAAVTPPVETATPETPAPTPGAVQTPEAPRVVTYEEAEGAFTARNYAEAVDLFTRYTETRPDNPWGHYMLGLSAWKAGRLDTAESELKIALTLDPAHLKSHLNLARVLLDAGHPGEAYTTIETLLAIDDTRGDAFRLKGRACRDLGRTDEAVAAYRRAIQLDPEDAWSMNNLAFIYIEAERFEEALRPLARAVELRGNVAVFHNNLGMALERTGHLEEAEDAYANAVAADPSNQKAVANGMRIAAVVKDPNAAGVDLAALAREFESEIDGWESPSLATGSEVDSTQVRAR